MPRSSIPSLLRSIPLALTFVLLAACSLGQPAGTREVVVSGRGDGGGVVPAQGVPPAKRSNAVPRVVELGLESRPGVTPEQFAVLDAGGQPLAGATVVIGPERMTTDERGLFTLPAAMRGQGEILADIAMEGHVGRTALLLPGYAIRLSPIEDNRTFVGATTGGVVRNGDGKLEVTIPPSALDRDAVVTVTRLYSEHDHVEAIHPGYRGMNPGLRERPSLGNYGVHVEMGGAAFKADMGVKARFRIEERLALAIKAGVIDIGDELKRDADGTLWFEMPIQAAIGAKLPPGGKSYKLQGYECRTYDDYNEGCGTHWNGSCREEDQYRVLSARGKQPRRELLQFIGPPDNQLGPMNHVEMRQQLVANNGKYVNFYDSDKDIVHKDKKQDASCYEYVEDDGSISGSMLHSFVMRGDKKLPGADRQPIDAYQAPIGWCLYRPHGCPKETCEPGAVIGILVDTTVANDAKRLVYVIGGNCPTGDCEPCPPEGPCPQPAPLGKKLRPEPVSPTGYSCYEPDICSPNPGAGITCEGTPVPFPGGDGDGNVPLGKDPEDIQHSPGPCGNTDRCYDEHVERVYHISQSINALVKWWSDDPRLKDKPVPGAAVGFAHKGTIKRGPTLSDATDANGYATGVGMQGAFGIANVSLPSEPWTYGTNGTYQIGCGPVPLFVVKNRPVVQLVMDVAGKAANGPFLFKSNVGDQKVPAVPVATIPLDHCSLTAANTPFRFQGSWKHDATCAMDVESPQLDVAWNRTDYVMNPVKVWFSREIATDLRYLSDDNTGPSDQVPPGPFQWAGKVPSGATVKFDHKTSVAALKEPTDRDKLEFTGVTGSAKTWGLSFATGRVRANVTGPDGTHCDGTTSYTIQNNKVPVYINANLPLMTIAVERETGEGKLQMTYKLRRSDGVGGDQTRTLELDQPRGGQWEFHIPVEDPIHQPYSWTFQILEIWGKGDWSDIRILSPGSNPFAYDPIKVQRGGTFVYPGKCFGMLTTPKYKAPKAG